MVRSAGLEPTGKTNEPHLVGEFASGSDRKQTVMAQQLQTTVEAHEADGRVHDELVLTEDRPMRLQILIAELLAENQKLRFKVAQLERQTSAQDGMLAEAKE